LAVVVAVKEFFSRRMLRLDAQYGATALKAEAWHHRSDAITSAAAFIGIAIGVIGGRGYEAADDWAALLACALISVNGVGIARAALGEIMDTAVSQETETEIRRLAGAVAGVRYVEKCRVLRSGLSLLVDIHVHVNAALTVREGHAIAHAVKDALMGATLGISDVAVHIEPARD
jgi:cation diffusion facilitator family transporter